MKFGVIGLALVSLFVSVGNSGEIRERLDTNSMTNVEQFLKLDTLSKVQLEKMFADILNTNDDHLLEVGPSISNYQYLKRMGVLASGGKIAKQRAQMIHEARRILLTERGINKNLLKRYFIAVATAAIFELRDGKQKTLFTTENIISTFHTYTSKRQCKSVDISKLVLVYAGSYLLPFGDTPKEVFKNMLEPHMSLLVDPQDDVLAKTNEQINDCNPFDINDAQNSKPTMTNHPPSIPIAR